MCINFPFKHHRNVLLVANHPPIAIATQQVQQMKFPLKQPWTCTKDSNYKKGMTNSYLNNTTLLSDLDGLQPVFPDL